MKTKQKLKLALMVLTFAFCNSLIAKETHQKEDIKHVIVKAIDAMYNTGNIEEIEKYYHQDFILFLNREYQLAKVTLNRILEGVKYKNAQGFYPARNKVTIDIVDVQLYNTAATVRFHYYVEEVQTCEDFMSLYFIDNQWKIVSQTTYHIQDYKK